MKYLIQVTKECIENGIIMSYDSCPISLAIRNIFYKEPHIKVFAHFLEITDKRYHIRLPPEAVQFQIQFNQFQYTEPFSFELDFPDEVGL